MDETLDDKPHVVIKSGPHRAAEAAPDSPAAKAREELSIWFFCGLLTLAYGVILLGQGVYEHFGHQPATVLANLEPTLWWGLVLTMFGGFFTAKFRPNHKA